MFLIAFLIWLITLPIDRKLSFLHLFSSFWGYMYIWLNPLWHCRIFGRDKIKRDRTYVIISNHKSMLDILVLYGLFRHFKWVSKKENFSIPIIGWLMKLNRYLEIDRGRLRSSARLMAKARQYLQEGNTLMMFPEGTRHPGDNFGPFRDGAFRMAIENRVGLLPVILKGTANTIPKGSIVLTGKQRMVVKICDEIPYESFRDKDMKVLMEEVREFMVKEYSILQLTNMRLYQKPFVIL
jgi:1-acyl-sn-glycerol-3-phosphate acyltransferase